MYLVAAEGTSWPIDLRTAESHFRQRWPAALVGLHTSAVTSHPYVTFAVVIGATQLHGTYTEHPHCLSLSHGGPQDWAETLVWFLTLLPRNVPVMAMADGDFRLVPVPLGASVQDIAELYERLRA